MSLWTLSNSVLCSCQWCFDGWLLACQTWWNRVILKIVPTATIKCNRVLVSINCVPIRCAALRTFKTADKMQISSKIKFCEEVKALIKTMLFFIFFAHKRLALWRTNMDKESDYNYYNATSGQLAYIYMSYVIYVLEIFVWNCPMSHDRGCRL